VSLLSRARFAARSFRAAWAGGGGGNYTDSLLDEAQAEADGGGEIAGLAAAEAVAGLYERAFAQGRAAGGEAAHRAAVTPGLLAQAGRALIVSGEVCWHVRERGRRWLISPACGWEIVAGAESDDPARWRYKLTIPTPAGSISREVASAHVAHVAIRGSASAPWWGRSVWQRAHNTARAAAMSERRLREELNAHTGQVAIWPGAGTADQIREIRRGLTQRQGQIAFVSQNRMNDAGGGPKILRVGASPPAEIREIREQSTRLLGAAAGIGAGLISPAASTQSQQAAIRAFLYTVILPLGGLVGAELARCFGADDFELRFQRLAAADLQARASAARRLADVAGNREALDLAGFYE